MDGVRVLFVLVFLVLLVFGCAIGCGVILNWPGRTPADPE